MSSPIIAYIKAHATPDELKRLRYIARRIKLRKATEAEIAEWQLVMDMVSELI